MRHDGRRHLSLGVATERTSHPCHPHVVRVLLHKRRQEQRSATPGSPFPSLNLGVVHHFHVKNGADAVIYESISGPIHLDPRVAV